MDDNLTVSEAGYKAEQINTYMKENSAEKGLQFNSKKSKYLEIGKNKEMNPTQNTLEVDTWDITYDEEDNIIETEGIKTQMMKVGKLKYLGFFISEDASNVPNISEKKNKSICIRRSIINMIKGLGVYAIKNQIIYLSSLLRGSILYAAETYYSLSERNYRSIEMIEEECIRKILETGIHCPISLLYLETGHIPARFQIQIMMLNFFKYILTQKKESLIFRFFQVQCQYPTKGNWISNIKNIMNSIDLNLTFEDISKTKNIAFKKLVDSKVKKVAVQYLKSKIKSKGKEIQY